MAVNVFDFVCLTFTWQTLGCTDRLIFLYQTLFLVTESVTLATKEVFKIWNTCCSFPLTKNMVFFCKVYLALQNF